MHFPFRGECVSPEVEPMITHDGSFEGFFTAIILAHERQEDIVDPEEGMFGFEMVKADPLLVEAWFAEVRERYGYETVGDFMALFLSEKEGMARLALHYYGKFVRYGSRVRAQLADPVVLSVMKIRRAYFFEVHRFQGLVRFRELSQGWLYGPLEPDHHILPYLWKHFSRRLPHERWILHDTRRDVAVCYDQQPYWMEGFLLEGEESDHYTEKEREMQRLWQSFYTHIVIPERKNTRLQRQKMPKKYWKYLIEKK